MYYYELLYLGWNTTINDNGKEKKCMKGCSGQKYIVETSNSQYPIAQFFHR